MQNYFQLRNLIPVNLFQPNVMFLLLMVNMSVQGDDISLALVHQQRLGDPLLLNPLAKKIDTVRNANKNDDWFSFPSKIRPHKKRIPKRFKLLNILPNAIDFTGASERWRLNLSEEICNNCQSLDFFYSGNSDSLFYLQEIGWGFLDNDNKFLPIVIDTNSYNDYSMENAYTFVWEQKNPRINNSNIDHNIYIPFLLQLPFKNKIEWGSDHHVNLLSFGHSILSTDLPLKRETIFMGNNGHLKVYDPEIGKFTKSAKISPKFSKGINYFAVDEDGNFYAVENDTIQALDSDGKTIWVGAGGGPLIAYHDKIITLGNDYQSIKVFNRHSGAQEILDFKISVQAPAFGNSFGVIVCDDQTYLLLIVPESNRLLVFNIMSSK